MRPLLITLLLLPACADPYRNWEPLAGDTAETEIAHEPFWSDIGQSRQNRTIYAATLGAGPTRVYLIGSIHGDEPEGQHAIDDIATRFRQDNRVTLRVVRDMNPDGSASRSRTNARGVDLNRNWPATNYRPAATRGDRALSEPETAAVHADLLRFDPDIVVVFHSSSRVHTPFVNYDGPANALAQTWADAARPHALNWGVVPSMGYPTPGSLGSFMGIDRDIPILTIEFQRGQRAESVRRSAIAGLEAIIAQSTHPRTG